MPTFCVVIKGNDKACRNYARRNCAENLCHAHRKLSDNWVEPEHFPKKTCQGTPDKCWHTHCTDTSVHFVMDSKFVKRYSCFKHTYKTVM